jgi:tRNA (guanine-N7-)-methyltransferase
MEKDLKYKREIFQVASDFEKILNFEEIFNNNNPVHLEIGSGRGEFLLEKSISLPEINFLGIDSKEKRIKTILRKLDIEKNKNVRVMKLLVDDDIEKFIPENSLEEIYIIYPDPWPKRKHHKNRLIQDRFIEALSKVIKFNGIVKLASDHKEYAIWVVRHFQNRFDFETIFEGGFTHIPPRDHLRTYFEVKKSKEGYNPFFMYFKKSKYD